MTHHVGMPNPYKENTPSIYVPVIPATEENFSCYGRIQLGKTQSVKQTRWQCGETFWRPLDNNTGYNNQEISGDFKIAHDQTLNALIGENMGVGSKENENSQYTIGWYDGQYLLIDEINNHPDSEQHFTLPPGCKIIFLLAAISPKTQSDNINLSDLTAFYFKAPDDQYLTVVVNPYVFHQPPILVDHKDNPGQNVTVFSRQGSIHACVTYPIFEESGVILRMKTNQPKLEHTPADIAVNVCRNFAAVYHREKEVSMPNRVDQQNSQNLMEFFKQFDWAGCKFLQPEKHNNGAEPHDISMDKIQIFIDKSKLVLPDKYHSLLSLLGSVIDSRIEKHRFFRDKEGNKHLYHDDSFALLAHLYVILTVFGIESEDQKLNPLKNEIEGEALLLFSQFRANEPPAELRARQRDSNHLQEVIKGQLNRTRAYSC